MRVQRCMERAARRAGLARQRSRRSRACSREDWNLGTRRLARLRGASRMESGLLRRETRVARPLAPESRVLGEDLHRSRVPPHCSFWTRSASHDDPLSIETAVDAGARPPLVGSGSRTAEGGVGDVAGSLLDAGPATAHPRAAQERELVAGLRRRARPAGASVRSRLRAALLQVSATARCTESRLRVCPHLRPASARRPDTRRLDERRERQCARCCPYTGDATREMGLCLGSRGATPASPRLARSWSTNATPAALSPRRRPSAR